jgi:hypothetical protein
MANENDGINAMLAHKLLFVILSTAGFFLIVSSIYIDATEPWPTTWQKNLLLGIGIACFPTGVLGLLYRLFLFPELEGAFKESTEKAVIPVFAKIDQKVDKALNPAINKLEGSIEVLDNVRSFGLEKIYEKRTNAMDVFKEYIREEEKEVQIIGSSLLGLIGTKEAPKNEIRKIFEDKVKNNKKFFKFLLTHPALACLREEQEGRVIGHVKNEIIETLEYLMNDLEVDEDCIKLYYGTPTIFCIITSKKMLINPYSNQRSAYETFCLEVNASSDIYDGLYETHFRKSWMSKSAMKFKRDQMALLRERDMSIDKVSSEELERRLGVSKICN